MNPRFQELKINSAKKRIAQNYSYLDIKYIYSSLDKEYNEIYECFRKLNFDKEIYPFNEETRVSSVKFDEQHARAIDLFIKKINSFNKTDNVYITIGFNGIGFWVQVDKNSFSHNLQRFIEEYGTDFYFYAFDNYGLQIYRAEYEWEVLYTF